MPYYMAYFIRAKPKSAESAQIHNPIADSESTRKNNHFGGSHAIPSLILLKVGFELTTGVRESKVRVGQISSKQTFRRIRESMA